MKNDCPPLAVTSTVPDIDPGKRTLPAGADSELFHAIPDPALVEHLRPARDICEACHWPEKFHGKRTKQFISFPNDNQKDPAIQEISLHIGGRSPYTETFEGIHWHVSKDVKVEYQSLNETRTAIGKIKVSKPNGITEEYNMPGETEEKKAGKEPGGPWTASTARIDRPMSTRISPRKSIWGCTPKRSTPIWPVFGKTISQDCSLCHDEP